MQVVRDQLGLETEHALVAIERRSEYAAIASSVTKSPMCWDR